VHPGHHRGAHRRDQRVGRGRRWLRESTESWAELLGDLRRRGMQAPVLAVGDGALGLWAALRDVFPATRGQRCWVHKTANVLAALPTSVHAGARRALAEITGAEDREHAEQAIAQFAADYGAKWPKAVAKVTDDIEALLAFYDFPAAHWVHLKTTNPVESTFATVRLRTRVTKRTGQQAGRAGDGVQAARGSRAALASRERSAPGRSRPGRRGIPKGGADRATGAGSGSRRVIIPER
jgi:hypothetical protein